MKILMGLGHVARYVLGAALSGLVFAVEAVLIYVALLVVAILFNKDVGGPFAGPVMILIAAELGVGVTVMVTLPALLLGDLMARRRSWFVAPIAAALCALLLLAAYVWGWGLAVGSPASETAFIWGVILAFSVLPLLTFMLLTYSSGAALALVARRRVAPSPLQPTTGDV
ncbi:hypothetical protein GCM10023176_26610 [Micromonospora coerulea]|uniref:Major facilitator superfamily (MFS) profile domain-containing protein n=1 Tax=Micromonospora coerulea TaxID=47856 RepID=A0ABP8SJ66_9ACTN